MRKFLALMVALAVIFVGWSTFTGGSTTSNAAPEEAAASLPSSDGEAGIEDSDGERVSLPLVDQVGSEPAPADTTVDPRTPPSLDLNSYETLREGGPLAGWDQLVERVEADGNLQWYIDAVNARKGKTGFDWEDARTWASTRTADGEMIDARRVDIYNMPTLTDDQAKDRIRSLVNDDAALAAMPVVHHDTCIVNTRGFGREVVQDFVDCRQMVRVSLAPFVFDKNGDVKMRREAGVFVDCYNIHWLPRQVVPHGPPPAQPAPTPSPEEVPDDTPTIVTCKKDCGPPPPPPGCKVNCEPPPSKQPTCKVNCEPTQPPNEKPRCPYNPALPDGHPDCLKPKSDKPQEYTVPSGKPTAAAPTEPPRSSPQPVVTSQPGGGGVTDSPTRKPGSESGVTAPGASSPEPQRTSPPSTESGANSPTTDENAPPEGGNDEPVEEPADW